MNYVIIPTGELNQEKVDACVESSLDTVRKSLDGSKAVLKYHEPQPSCLAGCREYTHADIIEFDSPDAEGGVINKMRLGIRLHI